MADKGKGSTQAQVKEIVKQLEDGMQELFTTEKYKEYLRVMSRFPKYSPRNVQLIHMQMPGASVVAGYRAWQTKFGRYVKRGETGIRILAPTPFTVKKEKQMLDPNTRQPILGGDGLPLTETVEERIPRFKVIPVFDVSQTDGKPLPELAEDLPGDVRHYELFMEALAAVSPLPIHIKAMRDGADGYCRYGEEIAIREGMGETQTISAAVHEIGHAHLHDPTLMPEKEREALEIKNNRTKEVEAESVSYVVCQYYGIETSPNSFGYIAGWSKSMELKELNASLSVIHKTATALIEGIDAKFRELAKERGIDLAPGREDGVKATEPPAAAAPGPQYDEQVIQAAFDRLKPDDLFYLPGAGMPLQLVEVREDDMLFFASSLAVELPRTHEQVLDGLRDNPKNRHLLELAAAELNPPAPVHEAAEPVPQPEEPEPMPNQHIETIGGVEYIVTGAGEHQPEQAPPSGEIVPDPAIGLSERDLFGYTRPGMLPATMERALELYDQDLTVYMLSPNNTEAMAFDRAEIEAHDGIFGVDAAEWRESAAYRRLEADQGEAARENELLAGEGDAYGIYQLKRGDELHHHRFTGLEQLAAQGNSVDRANYTLAYAAPLEPGTTLEDLFSLHNQDDRPAAREMRSMSVSDVVVLRQDGGVTSHYVDDMGFAELSSFLGAEGRQPEPPSYSQNGNTPEPESPPVADGPSVAELEAQVKAGQSISLLDLSNAVNRERKATATKAKPSILAQLHEGKKAAAQDGSSEKQAPKRDSDREV